MTSFPASRTSAWFNHLLTSFFIKENDSQPNLPEYSDCTLYPSHHCTRQFNNFSDFELIESSSSNVSLYSPYGQLCWKNSVELYPCIANIVAVEKIHDILRVMVGGWACTQLYGEILCCGKANQGDLSNSPDKEGCWHIPCSWEQHFCLVQELPCIDCDQVNPFETHSCEGFSLDNTLVNST